MAKKRYQLNFMFDMDDPCEARMCALMRSKSKRVAEKVRHFLPEWFPEELGVNVNGSGGVCAPPAADVPPVDKSQVDKDFDPLDGLDLSEDGMTEEDLANERAVLAEQAKKKQAAMEKADKKNPSASKKKQGKKRKKKRATPSLPKGTDSEVDQSVGFSVG